jgi:protein required for attachment to host cells
MSSSNESNTPTEDVAKKDDTLPMPEMAVINPNFSFDSKKLVVAAAERKLGNLRADLHKDLVQLIAEGKTVDEAVRIIKRKIANEPKGLGED